MTTVLGIVDYIVTKTWFWFRHKFVKKYLWCRNDNSEEELNQTDDSDQTNDENQTISHFSF